MPNDMFENAIRKVESLAVADASQLTLEEVGVLNLYLRARESKAALSEQDAERCRKVRLILDEWANVPAEKQDESQQPPHSRRTQHVLRNTIQKLCQREYGSLSGGEVLFVQSTLVALDSRKTPDVASVRLRDLLERELQAYEAYLAGRDKPSDILPEEPAKERPAGHDGLMLSCGKGADSVSPARKIDAEAFFVKKTKQRVEIVEGIETNLAVRVYEIEGNTVIDGDIPEDALVLVRNGNLTVDGYVEGNVAAAGDITVNGNVAGGCVVSSAGNILARVILSRSKAIAKKGQLSAERAENPACLFSLGALHIRGDAIGGKYLGASIRIDGDATSVELHSVGAIRAKAIHIAPHTQTVVCLRKSISSEDYGAPPPSQERKLYRSLGKFSHDAGVLEQFIHFAQRDLHDAQRTLLFYLLGGPSNPQEVRLTRGLQCQSSALAEIFSVGERIVALFRGAIASNTRITGPDTRLFSDQCIESLNHIATEVSAMANALDLAYKAELYRAGKLLSAVSVRLAREQVETLEYPSVAGEIERQSARWKDLVEQLNRESRARMRGWGMDDKAILRLEAKPEEAETLLAQTLAQAKTNPGSPAAQRALSSVARLIQSSIDRNQKNVRAWTALMDAARNELNTVRKTLFGTGVYLFADESQGGAQVTADSFDMGVVVAANPAIGGDPISTAQNLLLLREPMTRSTTFRLHNNEVIRDSGREE